MVVRGVPDRIAKDAWWLDDCDPPKGLRAWPLLVVALLGADFLIWDATGGIGFALWLFVAASAVYFTVWREISLRKAVLPLSVLAVGVLPLFEVVQFPTVVIALLALIVSGLLIAGARFEPSAILRAVLRLPGAGILRVFHDVFALRVAVPDKGSMRGVMFDWALPVLVGGLFIMLFIAANPLLDHWLQSGFEIDPDWVPGIDRMLFWCLMALVSWPLLGLSAMLPDLLRPTVPSARPARSGFVNARSVLRALVIFNVIFAVQTVLDLGYLWGGFALPEGMTYAVYAHRGAYPLLATALLAGLFALIAQPYLGGGAGLRRLLYLWIAQTLLLVVSSILRLELYVDVYGLTRLRFAAFVWMGVVLLGLSLIIWQMSARQSVGWFLARACGVGFAAFYVCCLVNIDGLIARHNLSQGFDDYYLCQLSEGAAPAIRAYELANGTELCSRYGPYVYQPDDWREWGYRNARLRRSLAVLEEQP